MAWSSDDGRTFGKPIDVDIDRPIGRVDIELLDDGSAIVSWLRSGAGNRGEICLREVAVSGELGPVQVVATTGASRASGFPQMMRDGTEPHHRLDRCGSGNHAGPDSACRCDDFVSANATD